MKIIHTADLHLESKMDSFLSGDQAKRRRGELLDSFEEMVTYGQKAGVSLILIAGDMFDKPSIRKTAIKNVFHIIASHPDITFLYLRGNHDCEAFESELFGDECPDNIKLFTTEKWTSYDFGEVTVSGREINDENSQSLYSDLVLDSGRFNIVMLHGQESMYDGKDKTHIVNLRNLQNKYIDYLALGHIHSYKEDKLGERGRYCYCGCPEPRGFDECGKKGFVLLNVDGKNLSTEFVSLQKRTFHEVKVVINPGMDMQEILELTASEIADIPSSDACKIIIDGYRDMDRYIDIDRIEEKFSDRFFFLKVYDKSIIKIEFENFAYDMTLKGSFVRLVQQQDMDEVKKAGIIDTGIRAIMGEDIQ